MRAIHTLLYPEALLLEMVADAELYCILVGWTVRSTLTRPSAPLALVLMSQELNPQTYLFLLLLILL